MLLTFWVRAHCLLYHLQRTPATITTPPSLSLSLPCAPCIRPHADPFHSLPIPSLCPPPFIPRPRVLTLLAPGVTCVRVHACTGDDKFPSVIKYVTPMVRAHLRDQIRAKPSARGVFSRCIYISLSLCVNTPGLSACVYACCSYLFN